ncbi:MAG: fused MFS/spermidine synthase [Planctomycetes bacterium]|nr:fused MFS/spermidine synthase [Planctomycetota bacterium]
MPTAVAARYMFVSGMAALVYEVLWVRDLGYLFGGSAQALSAVVAAFLAGLALGAFVAGRRVQPGPRLLWRYAQLELAIALFAPLAPWLIAGLDRALLDAWWPWLIERELATPVRFLVTFLLLLPATACMGATLPLLCTAFAGGGEKSGALIGRLYGWNTLGGVAGCLLAGFVLVEQVGLWKSRLVAAAFNVALALLAWRRDRAQARAAAGGAMGGAAAGPASGSAAARPPWREAPIDRAPWLAWPCWAGALVATSALSIVLEFGWTRLMALGVGGTTYAFSIVLALYLAGLGLGALVAAALARRGASSLRLLIGSQLLLALLLLALHPFIDDLVAGVGGALYDATARAEAAMPGARARLALLLGGVLVGVPSLLLGIAFPALSELRVAATGELGRGIGASYLLSTAGGVAASLATHFWLLPALGLERTLFFASLAVGVVAALLIALARGGAGRGTGGGARRIALAAGVLVAVAAGGFAVQQRGRWDPRAIYGGVGLYGPRALAPERQLLEVRDGASCSVAVFAQGAERSLAVNGKVDATSRGDMGTQLLLAWLPQLLARESKETFVLGYGAGVTAAAASRYGGRVTCAEIEEEVLAVSHHFADVNRAAHADPNIALIADDGRALLRRAPVRYDVITTEPSNPWLAGMAGLFTVEFYELCRERLAPGGVLCQWVQLYWSSPEDYQAIFATLGSVFPHVAIWKTTSGDTLMLGAMEPLALDPAELAQRAAARPWLAPSLAGSSASLAAQLAPMALLAGNDARAFADAGPRLIRDDVPFLEFSAARHMQANSVDAILARLYAERRTPLYQQEALQAALPANEVAVLLREVAAGLLTYDQASLAEPLLAEAHAREPTLERLPFWRWLSATKRGDAAEAARRLAELEQRAPALLIQVAEEHGRRRDFAAAEAALERLEAKAGSSPASEFQRGRLLELQGKKSDAVARYERALRLDSRMAPAREGLRRLREGR